MASMEDIYNWYLNSSPEELENAFLAAVQVDEHKLDQNRANHASTFAYWSVLTSIALTKYKQQDHFIKTQVWPDAKEAAIKYLESQASKATVDRSDSLAYKNPAYIAAVAAKTRYGHVLDIFKKVESALWQRKDMLQSMSTRARREEYAAPRPDPMGELKDHIDTSLRNYKQPDRTVEELESIATQVLGTKHGR